MEKVQILDTSVAMHRSTGTITVFTLIEYPPAAARSFELIFPEHADYSRAVQIAYLLRQVGKPVGAIDILISAMCINRQAELVTKDKDYLLIQKYVPALQVRTE